MGLASESASLPSSSMGSCPPRIKSATCLENNETAGFEVLMLPELETRELSTCFLPFYPECFLELLFMRLEFDSSKRLEEYWSSSSSPESSSAS